MDLNDAGSTAENKIVGYFDKNPQVARTAAWVAVGLQLLMAVLIALGSINSILAAFVCVATAGILVWLLNKTRPVLPTNGV